MRMSNTEKVVKDIRRNSPREYSTEERTPERFNSYIDGSCGSRFHRQGPAGCCFLSVRQSTGNGRFWRAPC
jgi:hypothetical protein